MKTSKINILKKDIDFQIYNIYIHLSVAEMRKLLTICTDAQEKAVKIARTSFEINQHYAIINSNDDSEKYLYIYSKFHEN